MGDFQELKDIEGLQVSSVSANLYKKKRRSFFILFSRGCKLCSSLYKNSIVSESITWNRENTKNNIKALIVNTKNAILLLVNKGLIV